jgi:hypothetical protein
MYTIGIRIILIIVIVIIIMLIRSAPRRLGASAGEKKSAGCAALIPAGLAIDRLGPKPVLLWAAQVTQRLGMGTTPVNMGKP